MEPIRVLNLFTIMNRGGAETMVMNYYRHIDREKVQFDFLVHREEEGAYEDEIRALGGRIYRMIPIYPQNFSKYKKMLHDFFEKHPEYRIIHSHMSELGYFAFKEAKKQGVPVRICHAHSSPHELDLKMIMREYFKYRIRPYTTHMFTCGQEAAEWLFGKKNRKKYIQLNNAIDTENFLYNKDIDLDVRRELGVENHFVVGHVGNFTRPKNHLFLIDVFYEIQKQKKDAVLVLVGTGVNMEAAKRKVNSLNITEKVFFLGNRSDVYRIMQCFDVFVFPSTFEGLPVTMVEAQTNGNICFISDVIPQQCCLTDNVIRISLNESPARWAEYILEVQRLYKKGNMYEIISKKGFDIKKNAKWLEEFYINATE